MGRKSLYNEKAVSVSFKVPESKVSDFKLKVSPILKSYEVKDNVSKHILSDKTVNNLDSGLSSKKECSCQMDGNLFRRDKNCKIPKEKHE